MRNVRILGLTLMVLGASTFIFVLYISAYWQPDIRWLHFLQSWMYIGALVLVFRRSKWGCFIGAAAPLFWNYINVFVVTFFRNGLQQAHLFLATGRLERPDLIVAVPGWFGNLALIIGSALVYVTFPQKRWSDLGRLLTALVLTLLFFAGAMALSQPRYLPLFKAALHPSWRL